MSSTFDKKIRVGVCGTGFWAEQVHLPGYACENNFELAGVFGRNVERTMELAEKFGGTGYTDFDVFLANVDAVSFAVPPTIQADLALRATKAGKAVMLEKPAATSVEDARLLASAVEARGVAAMVYLPRLYSPSILSVVSSAIDRRVIHGQATFRSGALLPGSPYAGSVWRQDDVGAIWDIGPHSLSVLMRVFGPIASVRVSNPRKARFECEFVHANDARSTAILDLMDEAVDGFQESYVFGGDHGSVESGEIPNDRIGFFKQAAGDFAVLVREGRADLKLGFAIVAVLDAACLSVASGRPCKVLSI